MKIKFHKDFEQKEIFREIFKMATRAAPHFVGEDDMFEVVKQGDMYVVEHMSNRFNKKKSVIMFPPNTFDGFPITDIAHSVYQYLPQTWVEEQREFEKNS